MVEFALVIGILMLLLGGAIGAAMWSIGRMAAVNAAENGVRAAIGAHTTGVSSDKPDLSAASSVVSQLRTAMPGTNVVWKAPPVAPDHCPDATQVMAGQSSPKVVVCAEPDVIDNHLVHVSVTGCANVLVPTFSITGCAGGVAINIVATGYNLVFGK
ncbi:MAG: TadE family protein [Candidatus Dormibacteria bacterium]